MTPLSAITKGQNATLKIECYPSMSCFVTSLVCGLVRSGLQGELRVVAGLGDPRLQQAPYFIIRP